MRQKICSMLMSVFLLISIAACGNSAAAWQEQYDLGVRYLSEGNYEEAIIAFTAAIEIDPKAADSYLGRAEAYLHTGDENAALEDIRSLMELMDTLEQAQERLEHLKDLFEDQNQLQQLLEEYFPHPQVNTTPVPTAEPTVGVTAEPAVTPIAEPTAAPEPSAEVTAEPDDVIQTTLSSALSSYGEKRVTSEEFFTCYGADIVPNQEQASGFISGCLRDVDCDGEPELVSAWSDGSGIWLKLEEYEEDGSLREAASEMVLSLDYCSNLKLALYHRPATDQWLVAAGSFTERSFTGYRGYECKLYQFQPEGIVLQHSWEYNNMIMMETPFETLQMESVQWPLQIAGTGQIDPGTLDSLTYLADVWALIDPGEDGGFSYEDITYSQRFLSQAELDEMSQPDIGLLGSHSAPTPAPEEMIGKTLTELTAVMGVDYQQGMSEGGYDYTYGSQTYVFNDDGIVVDVVY